MKLDFNFVKACKDTKVELDGVINALGGTYPPIPPSNPKTVVTYQNGDIVEYEIEGELGSNSIPDKTNAVRVDIGTAVTSIGEMAFSNAFSDYPNLTSIMIPNSVTSIGNSAFSTCAGLTSITIPDSVTSIGDRAFTGCSGLTSITIPNSVTSVGGNSVFSGCTNLSSVIIENGVTSIGYGAFVDCSSLSSIIIPSSVTNIGVSAFSECKDLTIYCVKGSYAEKYANDNKLKLEDSISISVWSVSGLGSLNVFTGYAGCNASNSLTNR